MQKFLLSLVLLVFAAPLYAYETKESKVEDPTYGGKVYRAWHIATFHFGASQWQDDSGHIGASASLDFDDNTVLAWGGQYLFLFDWGLGVGISTQLYEKDITLPTGMTPAKVLHGHAILQYHFNRGGDFKPFVGIGSGVVAIGFDDGALENEELTGISYELSAGATWRITETFGILAQYRFMNFNIDEETSSGLQNDIDSSSHSVLLGVSFYF